MMAKVATPVMRCKERVYGGTDRCSRTGTAVLETGYCRQHDPERLRAKREEWEKRFQAERTQDSAAYARLKVLLHGSPEDHAMFSFYDVILRRKGD